ncbi:MAG: methyl-accepting chemotaxis protein, partial [Nitrospirota bacterium]
MKKEITLATKFTITLLIILFIGQTLGFILFILSVRSSMIDSLNEKMKRTASLLAGLSVNPILEKNNALLNTYLEEIMRDEDIVSVAVFGSEETLLGHKSKTLPHEPSIINPFHVEPFFKSKTPVTLKSEKIGYIITTSSTMKINDEISKYIIFGTIYCGVLLIVVIFLVSEFFSKNIRKPISDFSVAAGKVAAGDFTVTVQPEKNPEMKILTDGFNSMTSNLKNIFQKLYFTVNGITITVKQLNLFVDRIVKRTGKQTDATESVISAMEKAEDSQKKILNNTHDLAAFSQDNLSSFGQMDATTKEISEMTKELSLYSSEVYFTSANILAEAKTITKEAEEFLKSTEGISSSIEDNKSDVYGFISVIPLINNNKNFIEKCRLNIIELVNNNNINIE